MSTRLAWMEEEGPARVAESDSESESEGRKSPAKSSRGLLTLACFLTSCERLAATVVRQYEV